MNIVTGTQTTYLAASVSGRVVASFEKRVDLDNWITARQGNKVTYRTFEQRMVLVELSVRQARPLRVVEG